jgi:hypothetical protein
VDPYFAVVQRIGDQLAWRPEPDAVGRYTRKEVKPLTGDARLGDTVPEYCRDDGGAQHQPNNYCDQPAAKGRAHLFLRQFRLEGDRLLPGRQGLLILAGGFVCVPQVQVCFSEAGIDGNHLLICRNCVFSTVCGLKREG